MTWFVYILSPVGRGPSMPGSAWADGKLAELAEQLGKMVEHPKSKSTQLRLAKRCVTRYQHSSFHLLRKMSTMSCNVPTCVSL